MGKSWPAQTDLIIVWSHCGVGGCSEGRGRTYHPLRLHAQGPRESYLIVARTEIASKGGAAMGKVITQASMSLDGYIADLSDNVGPLFDWSTTGDVEVTGADPNMVFRVSAPSANYLREAWANIRASVIGRRLFDLANGWDGRPPVGEAVLDEGRYRVAAPLVCCAWP